MISDVDIRDWDKIDIPKAREIVDDLDDFAKMWISVDPVAAMKFMNKFLDDVEELKRKQTRHIPKLERKD